MPDGESTRFQVVRDEHVIHECRIIDGTCDFYLPPRNRIPAGKADLKRLDRPFLGQDVGHGWEG